MKLCLFVGLPLCGKSTLAHILAIKMRWGYVESSVFGTVNYSQGVANNPDRMHRYERMFNVVKCLMKDGLSVVVDASFAERQHRYHLYEIGMKMGVDFFCIVEVQCNDRVLIHSRAVERGAMFLPDEKLMNETIIDAYAQCFQPIVQDELPSGVDIGRIIVDTQTNTLREMLVSEKNEPIAMRLTQMLDVFRMRQSDTLAAKKC